MRDGTEILQELTYSLTEWGLGRTTGHSNADDHERLRKKIIQSVHAMLNETLDQPDDFQDLIKVEFPNTLEQAYEYVLHHDDVGNGPWSAYSDSIETSGRFAPFFRRKSPQEVIRYQRKPQFQKYKLEQLDPLNRFRYKLVSSKAELFGHWWFFGATDASRRGVFMEAALACHAIHKEPCFNCKYRRTLRWKGGSGAAWQDLVCTKCRAIYEVKTKETMEDIRKTLERNQIPGGSFRAARRLELSRPLEHKRFVILLPRNATSKRGQMVHPVQVHEISKIMPAACELTFDEKAPSVLIRSIVSVASLSGNMKRHWWFDLPEAKSARPLKEILKQVFVQRFSEEEFEKLKSEYDSGNIVGPAIEEKAAIIDDEAADTLEELKRQFAELDTSDDWEDLLSDSDDQS